MKSEGVQGAVLGTWWLLGVISMCSRVRQTPLHPASSQQTHQARTSLGSPTVQTNCAIGQQSNADVPTTLRTSGSSWMLPQLWDHPPCHKQSTLVFQALISFQPCPKECISSKAAHQFLSFFPAPSIPPNAMLIMPLLPPHCLFT